MKFTKLIALLEKSPHDFKAYIPAGADVAGCELESLVSDSRKAGRGCIFACVTGEHSDGHDYAAKAVEAGAAALLCERRLELPVPQLLCSNVRSAMGAAASALYENPSGKLTMIAVTGTAGKTTSTFMTRSILQRNGIKTGLLGTVWYDDGARAEDADRTTPEGSDVQDWLRRMVANGCGACVMETSSHSIVQGRLNGALYDRAGFTNLSVDHLDYHKDMESYFKAKKTLFERYMRGNWRAAVNIGNAYGARLAEELGSHAVTYALDNGAAMFSARVLGRSIEGLDAEITTPDSKEPLQVKLPVLGDHNVMNALQALSLAWTLGIGSKAALDGLTEMEQVPGRLERYIIEDCGSCVIDFAHTSDELEKALVALRPVCKGRLIVTFGAGGDRDRSKRPLMGEIATRLADKVIITSDNPRTEDPVFITTEIEAGAAKHPETECQTLVDRREAIGAGLAALGRDDILLVAGKGPERYQILKNGTIPFLDKDEVFKWCAANGRKIS